MNKLGSAGEPGTGSFLTADPASEHQILTTAAHAAERRALTALRERQNGNDSPNGDH
jgi:ubiquinol-cytochrome c reductase cytochrome b subunit